MMGEKFTWGIHTIDGENIHLAGWDTHTDIDSAQQYCTAIAKAHYENFLITNYFTPKHIRQHIENIYAFCRYADDLGDEAPFEREGRIALLETWQSDLEEAAKDDWSGNPRHPILLAVAHTSKKFNIPLKPYVDLIQAFKLDQTKTTYSNFDELREYCILSADPVGHLFLYVYGHDDENLRRISDYTCTALQLANHWQDVARDLDQNRSYFPIETMEMFGYTPQDYQNRVYDERWCSMMKHEVDRAQKWFDDGKQLWDLVDPHLAVDLRMFTFGGEAILNSIRKQKYNTWKKRPRVSKFSQLKLFFTARKDWKKVQKMQNKSN
jgi:squalene synthase HpnC